MLLGATRHGPGLAFFDEEGRARVWSGFRSGGAVLSFSDARRVPRLILKLRVLASSVSTYSAMGRVRTAIVIAGKRSAVGLFGQTGLPRLAVALGEYVPVAALFDNAGRILQEPLHHALPGLFVEAAKAAASLWQRFARRRQARQTAV